MNHRIPISLFACAALFVAVACNPDTVPDKPGAPPQNGVTVGHHGPANVGAPFTKFLPSGTTSITVANSDFDEAVDAAATAWANPYVNVSRGGGTTGWQVVVTYTGTGTLSAQDSLCGSTALDSAMDMATISIGSGNSCAGDDHGKIVNFANLASLMTHEMGHALGFAHYAGSNTNNCIMNLDSRLNTSPCAHEYYALAYGHGVGSTDPEADLLIVSRSEEMIVATPSSPIVGDTLILSIPDLYAALDGSGISSSPTATSSGDQFKWILPTLATKGPVDTVYPSAAGAIFVRAQFVSRSGWLPQIPGDTLGALIGVTAVPTPSTVGGTNLDASHLAVNWTNASFSGGTNYTQVQLFLGATRVANDSFAYGKTADTVAISTDSMYTAQVRHIHNGNAGSWASAAVGTVYPVVSAFAYYCDGPPITGQNGFIATWSFTGSPSSGWNYEVWSTDDNVIPPSGTNPAEDVSGSGLGGSYVAWDHSSDAFYYPHNHASTLRYFWLRFSNGSAHSPWIANLFGPVFVSSDGPC